MRNLRNRSSRLAKSGPASDIRDHEVPRTRSLLPRPRRKCIVRIRRVTRIRLRPHTSTSTARTKRARDGAHIRRRSSAAARACAALRILPGLVLSRARCRTRGTSRRHLQGRRLARLRGAKVWVGSSHLLLARCVRAFVHECVTTSTLILPTEAKSLLCLLLGRRPSRACQARRGRKRHESIRWLRATWRDVVHVSWCTLEVRRARERVRRLTHTCRAQKRLITATAKSARRTTRVLAVQLLLTRI